MKILIKFPSRGRPEQFKDILNKYISKLSGKHEVKFVFTFDLDDSKMNNQAMVDHLKSLNINMEYYFGNSSNKIEAINANMDNQVFDVLILASDDMIPILDSYDDEIVKKFEQSGLGLDCMLHTHSTMWSDILDVNCIMGWDYYKRFNYIYHPAYKSIFVDNEYTEVSKILKKNIFTPNFTPFFHEWKSGDETEVKNWQFNNQDYKVYEERKKKNYDLPMNKKIISFSLWGDNLRYTIGAIKNAELAETIYPGWVCRYYVGNSVPQDILDKLISKHNVEIVKMDTEGSWNSMFWRFYSIADKDVEIMLSRDCDSRLSIREKECVDEFVNSDKKFHTILDHPFHSGIMGGMWGAKRGILGNIKQLIDDWPKNDKWQIDQSFLNTVIQPLVKEETLTHDSIILNNFSSKREDYKFIGEIYGHDDSRYEQWVVFTFPEFKHLS